MLFLYKFDVKYSIIVYTVVNHDLNNVYIIQNMERIIYNEYRILKGGNSLWHCQILRSMICMKN